jgi:hypothetical protein
VKLFTTAMMGLPKSPSFIPVARQSERAPAMLRPKVDVRERYCGMPASYHAGQSKQMQALRFAFRREARLGEPGTQRIWQQKSIVVTPMGSRF